MTDMKIIGHRGAAGHAPENTLAAVRKGLLLGADGVEVDLRLSLDGIPVVMHDASTARTGTVDFAVAETPWELLKTIDVGCWFDPQFAGEKIPRLEEVLALLPAGKILQLEIKAGEAHAWIVLLKKHLYGPDRPACHPVLIAFDPDLLDPIKRSLPEAETLLLLPAGSTDLSPDTLHNGYGIARQIRPSPAQRAALQDRGKTLGVWTVNDPAEKKDWQDRGIAMLATDFPDRFC